MGYLHKVDRHKCDLPKDAMRGDVWQCDDCKKILMMTNIGWFPAEETDKGWKIISHP